MSESQFIDLNALRIEITELDETLLRLFSRRREISIEVAKSKIQDKRPVRDVEREALLMKNLIKKGEPLNLDDTYLTDLFRVIIEDSVDRQIEYISKHSSPEHHQTKTKVAFLGGKGFYSHIATNKYFARTQGNVASLLEVGCKSFDDIFQAIMTDNAEHALLPLENTSSGSINEVYDLLQKYAENIHIVGEQTIPVKHNLLTAVSTSLDQIKTIYGHFQPIAQCSEFLGELPEYIHIEAVESSSAAMQTAKDNQDPSVAIIGSQEGGDLYNLTTLVEEIANQKEANDTRFVVISKRNIELPQQSLAKTSLIMSVDQKPGALVKPLLAFSEKGIDLCKLESRPINGRPKEEMFYMDALTSAKDQQFQDAITDILHKRLANQVKILGCYERER